MNEDEFSYFDQFDLGRYEIALTAYTFIFRSKSAGVDQQVDFIFLYCDERKYCHSSCSRKLATTHE